VELDLVADFLGFVWSSFFNTSFFLFLDNVSTTDFSAGSFLAFPWDAFNSCNPSLGLTGTGD
jgi:hypothetical protein